MFSWISLFNEIAHWILPYRNRQKELCDILRNVGFTGNLEDEDNNGKKGLEKIDPFTFFSFFMKIKNEENRIGHLKKLKELVGLKRDLPTDFAGVPSAQPMSLWYFGGYEKDRGADVIDLLWDFAEEAISDGLSPKTFQTVLALPRIQIAKLSQGLFWLNPNSFYPIDAHRNYLEENGINPEVANLDDYLNVLEKIKSKFQKPFYEISHDAWLNNQRESSTVNFKKAKIPTETNRLQTKTTQSLNTILYGPPGTGKTYNTINKAVAIASPEFDQNTASRKKLQEEYNHLVKEGQIEFVTFHQGMSYEDFIEGIKPMEPREGDPFLKYEIKEGIFRRLCERALKVPDKQPEKFSISEDEFENSGFYKLSLGDTSNPDDDQIYKWCIDNGYIALGWGDAINFIGLKENDIQLLVPSQLEKFAAQAVNYFIHYLKPGDYVVITLGNLRFRAIGKITGNYEFKNVEGLSVHQFRKVEWLIKDVELPYEDVYNKQFSQQSIYRLNKLEIKRELFVKASKGERKDSKLKNYVLIIDEINRGNVSQVFGELITLIEVNKRAGNKEELSSLLPYSNQYLKVPSNLFIIATMNTADRSVEALDTALRRRFIFEEMMPKPELLHPKEIICRFWNLPEYSEMEWDEEPYQTKAHDLYDLLGIEYNIDERILNNDSGEDRDWRLSDFDLINDSEFTGIGVGQLLETINKRIERLLGRDNCIGHSYFLKVYSLKDLMECFKNQIIPLLQEYFYGDYGKMGLVLGKGFVDVDIEKSSENQNFFAKADYDSVDSYLEKKVWKIKEIKKEDEFRKAIDLLLNN